MWASFVLSLIWITQIGAEAGMCRQIGPGGWEWLGWNEDRKKEGAGLGCNMCLPVQA